MILTDIQKKLIRSVAHLGDDPMDIDITVRKNSVRPDARKWLTITRWHDGWPKVHHLFTVEHNSDPAPVILAVRAYVNRCIKNVD